MEGLEEAGEPLRGGLSNPDNLPPWVEKLVREILNLQIPKNPFRPGLEISPKQVGRALGSQFVFFAQHKRSQAISAAGIPAVKMGFDVACVSAKPQFDLQAAVKNAEVHLAEVEARYRQTLLRVMEERPFDEVADFFCGFATGLRNMEHSIIPEPASGVRKFTAQQVQRMRTTAVYWLVFLNWQKIDRLQTSQEAFDFLAAILPEELIGNDAERIRKMFYRFGKKFKASGRPSAKRR